MIHKTQNNIQEALNITIEEADKIMHNTDILADNGYYTNETIYKNYNEEHYSLIIPNKKQATQQKDKLKRKTQRKENKNKKDGFSIHNMIKDEENYCYICPENQILPVQQIYPEKYNDRIIYYTSAYSTCPSKNKCLTDKMTGKVLTDYTSEAKEIQTYKFETPQNKKLYS